MGELHLKIVTLNIRRVYYPDKLANEKKKNGFPEVMILSPAEVESNNSSNLLK